MVISLRSVWDIHYRQIYTRINEIMLHLFTVSMFSINVITIHEVLNLRFAYDQVFDNLWLWKLNKTYGLVYLFSYSVKFFLQYVLISYYLHSKCSEQAGHLNLSQFSSFQVTRKYITSFFIKEQNIYFKFNWMERLANWKEMLS